MLVRLSLETMMNWYLGAALLGAAILAIGINMWWSDEGRSEYEEWALRGGRSLGVRTDE
jgi:hypothetical protein